MTHLSHVLVKEPIVPDMLARRQRLRGALWGATQLLAAGTVAVLLYVSPRWQFFRSDGVIWLRGLQGRGAAGAVWDELLHGSPYDYRPVCSLYLRALHGFFADWAPAFYGANLLVHLINCVLVFRIARRLGLSP